MNRGRVADEPTYGASHVDRAIDLAQRHVAKFREARPRDVYKLIYQACMGSEHAVADAGTMLERLAAEWNSLGADPNEELYEDLGIHFPIFRINLRAAKARAVEPERILDSFKELARTFPVNGPLLKTAWACVSAEIRSGGLPVSGADGLEELDGLIKSNGFPAVHHSREYSARHRPSYRLVHRGFD